MVKCKSCGKEVSQFAWKCPHCGSEFPTTAKIIYFFIFIIAILTPFILLRCQIDNSEKYLDSLDEQTESNY